LNTSSTSSDQDFDLVAMWAEMSETLQSVIAERETQIKDASDRCFSPPYNVLDFFPAYA